MTPTGLAVRAIAFVVALTALVALVYGAFRHVETLGKTAAQKETSDLRASYAASAAQAAQAAQAETVRRVNAQQEIAHDAQLQADAARADAARARVASSRLLDRVRAADSRGCSGSPSAPAGSAPAGAASGVPAEDVLGQLLSLAGRYAADADDARRAGLACVRAYEALSP
jgi:Protein of unknown function (DUF2514)